MAFYKNKAGQKIPVFAVDALGVPKTGDAAHITAQISQDGGASAPTDDTNPTELDAVNQKGIYLFDMLQAETNADLICLSAASATSGVIIRPAIIETEPEKRAATLAAADVSGNLPAVLADAAHGGANAIITAKQLVLTNVGGPSVSVTGGGSLGAVEIKSNADGVAGIWSEGYGDGAGVAMIGGAGQVGNVGGYGLLAMGGSCPLGQDGDGALIDNGGQGKGLVLRGDNGAALELDATGTGDGLKAAPAGTGQGINAAEIYAIYAKIAAGAFTPAGDVPGEGELPLIVQGDDYTGASVIVLDVPWTGPSITGATAVCRLQPVAEYEARTALNVEVVSSLVIGAYDSTAGTYPVSIPLAAAQSARLIGAADSGALNYRFEVEATIGGTPHTVAVGTVTVLRQIG